MKDVITVNRKKLLKVYIWALNYLRKYKWKLAGFVFCGCIISLSEIIIPQFMKYIVDIIIPSKDLEEFKGAYFVLIFCCVSIVLCILVSNILERIIRESVSRDVLEHMISQLQKLGVKFGEENTNGNILSIFTSDLQAMLRTYTDFIPFFIKSIIIVMNCLILLAITNLGLILLVSVCLGMYCILRPLPNRHISKYLGLQVTSKHDFDQQIYDSICSYADVKANGNIKWCIERVINKLNIFINIKLKSLFWRYFSITINIATGAIANIVFLIYCFILYKNNQISLGTFVSNNLYFIILYRYVTKIVGNINEQVNVLKNAEYIYEFINIKPEFSESNRISIKQINGKITFKDVSFYYNDGNYVLKDLNLNINAGEKVAIVGISGGGKSTILKLAMQFYNPVKGQILIDDIPISRISLQCLRQAQGIVFQDVYLFGTTIRENIRFGKPEATNQEVEQAAKLAYAHDFIMRMQDGYDTIVGERGVKLSGGQKQRIAIARMYIKNPSIIFLDEATSALDNISEVYIKKTLEEFSKKKTIIAIAHRLSTIKDYDRIIVLNNGEVVEARTYEELYNERGIFYNWTIEGEAL